MKRLVLFLFLGLFMLSFVSSTVNWNNGLIAYYRFDEGDGLVANNVKGTYNLNATNSNILSNCVGLIGGCANFTTAGSILNGTFSGWATNESFTVSFWIRNDDYSRGNILVLNNSYNFSGTPSYSTGMGARFPWIGATSNLTTSNMNQYLVYNRTWNHIVFSWNNSEPTSQMRRYINGVETILGAPEAYKIRVSQSSSFLTLGGLYYADGVTPFTGQIDELSIWSRALNNVTELPYLYNSGNGYSYPNPPIINFSNNPSGYFKYGDNIQLNITANDPNLSKVWYNYNGTNVFLNGAISGIANLSNITLTSNKTITIYANNTYSVLKTEIFNLNYKVWYNSDTYVNLTYAGVTNPFTINITSPNINSIKLNYNGTNYTAGSYLSGNNTIGSVNVLAPTFSSDQNISFYWIFTMIDGSIVTNSAKNQTVKIINLGNTYPFLIYNITVVDENTGLVVPNTNVTMSYEVTYGISNTSIIGTNIFNDNKLANKNISSDIAITNGLYMSGNIVYSATGYIGRTYSFTENNISTYKNVTLYISLATVSYVKTMYVTDEGGRGKAALFKQYTNLNGVKTLIATEQLDSTGKTTIVFTPNIQYTFEFTNVGCLNLTKNIIFYDQTDYNQVLSCSNYNPDDYLDQFEGMVATFSPNGVFNVNNATNTSASLFSVNISGTSSFCDSVSVVSFNVYNQLGNTIVNDNGNSCDVLFGSGLFNNFATGSVYILLDSGEEKTLTFKWIKLYSDSDYSNYSILTLLGEVGNSDDILGIDWKFKILISFIGLLGIIIALTIYQRIYNFSNLSILIVADIYIWFMCFIGWVDLNIGASSGGITALVSKYALLILAVIASAGIIATKEDEYS